MGYKVTTPVWDYSKAKGGDLLVLIAIADSADNETGVAFPSIRYLAAKSRLTERTVQYAITRLRKLGELEVIQNTGRVNTFRVTLFVPELSPGEEKRMISKAEALVEQRQGGAKIAPPKPVDNSRQGGAKIAPRGVQPSAGGGAIHDTPYIVLEPVIEPVSLSHSPLSRKILTTAEREMVTKDLKRILPTLASVPDAVSSERAFLFLHKIRTGEIRKEQLYSPVAYMTKLLDEDITQALTKWRAARGRGG